MWGNVGKMDSAPFQWTYARHLASPAYLHFLCFIVNEIFDI